MEIPMISHQKKDLITNGWFFHISINSLQDIKQFTPNNMERDLSVYHYSILYVSMILQISMYVYITTDYKYNVCTYIYTYRSLRGGRSPKGFHWGVQLRCDLFRIYFGLFQGLLRVGLDFCWVLVKVVFGVVLGFAHGCFVLGSIQGYLWLIQGSFIQGSFRFIQSYVILVFFQSLAVC